MMTQGTMRSGALELTLMKTRDITLPFPPDVAGGFSTGTAFEMNTDPVVVALVGCATQPVGAHIPGLPDLSGDIDEYAGGGGGGGFVC